MFKNSKDKELNDNLALNNKKIRYIIHPAFKEYTNCFKVLENDNIKIDIVDDIEYTTIFNELGLLITDYSSIMFDAAFLKKPIILLQDDKDDFVNSQYSKGHFDYERDAFYDIVHNTTLLKEKLISYINGSYIRNKEYDNVINNTFKYLDSNNSKRVYNVLLELLEE